MTRLRLIILAALLAWLLPGFVCAQPTLVCQWNIAGSSNDFGTVGWGVLRTGWPGFIRDHVKPAIAWCEASGVKPVILIHHPFGQYTCDPPAYHMHIDGYDYARGVKALVNDFATQSGWKPITSKVDCYAYLGGVDLTPRLRDLPIDQLSALIARNLKPIADAGFRGVFIDAAENAIWHDFKGVNEAQSCKRSLDTLTLQIADQMFPARTGVEIAPRAFPQFSHLWDRPCVMEEANYQHRFGVNRHANWKALGYDRKYHAVVWRTLNYNDSTLEAARAIAKDGDTPVVFTQPLIAAGIKAGEVFK